MGSLPSPLASSPSSRRARGARAIAGFLAAGPLALTLAGGGVAAAGAAGTAGATSTNAASPAVATDATVSPAASAAVTPALASSTGLPPQNLAPYVPTPQDVVDRMLELAQVTKSDVVYDIGCGDGRIVITAAKRYGARGVGIDIDPARIAEARAQAAKEGVAGLVEFREQDALQADVSPASVVMLSLLPSFNLKLRPILTKQLKAGSRIVSLQFDMGNWPPAKRELFTDANGATRPLFLWTADGTAR
jgi:SAM-dependent methyltransferase